MTREDLNVEQNYFFNFYDQFLKLEFRSVLRKLSAPQKRIFQPIKKEQ